MSTQTPTQRLASALLGQDVQDWIAAQRAGGQSWRRVARSLFEATGVDVTHETLRSWATERVA